MCAQLSKDLEKALLLDERNLFCMRTAFFHSPTAAPVLLKVVYHITRCQCHQECGCKGITLISDIETNLNLTVIEFKQSNNTYGWASAGIYTVFHPGVLNSGLLNYTCSPLDKSKAS